MKPSEYLLTVLEGQQLSEDSDEYKKLISRRKNVESIIKAFFSGAKVTIRYGGSIAKGTIILEDYDLDLVFYFETEDTTAGQTLGEIYKNFVKALQVNYIVKEKKSSIRLKGKSGAESNIDFHIDVVPGRYTDASKQDVFIYQSGSDKERLKTNIEKHIEHVRKSGLIDVIKLAKLWKSRRDLSIKTFVLELLVIKTLENVDRSLSINQKLIKFWEILRDKKGDISIEDPANPQGNDLSTVWDTTTKSKVVMLAKMTLDTIKNGQWEDVFGSIEKVSREEKISSIQVTTSSRGDRARPWSC